MQPESPAFPNPESENQPGRNYREVLEAMRVLPRTEQRIDLRVGDYLEMPGEEFASWASRIPAEGNPEQTSGDIRVTIAEIKADETIVVHGNGITKEVHASLFYNFGRHFPH